MRKEKHRWSAGLVAFALALALALAGCGAGERARPETESGGQVHAVPGGEAEEGDNTFAPEYPGIEDAPVFSGSLESTPVSVGKAGKEEEMRGVWISYLEMEHLLKGKTAKQFTANIGAAFDKVAAFGLNTVVVQVRPFADALYDSDYFPWSYTITGTEGKDPGFDPLAVMVREAKSRNLRIEAWINPYRVRAAGNNNALSAGNQAKKWLDAGSGSVIQYGGVTSYNPASEEARKLIVNGVVEIVKNYDVDGVHIDDYFYPSTDAAFDKASYTAYKEGGGKLALADWRRSNVEKLVKAIYTAVKKANPKVLFGISPQSSVQNNYASQYLDVEKIAGNAGYCDYICPQIYFGYDNEAQPYKATLKQWGSMVKGSPVKLYVGLAAYKIGTADSWAGAGKNEWTENTNLLGKMVEDARDTTNYQGFVLYRYDSIFNPASSVKGSVQKESKSLRSKL